MSEGFDTMGQKITEAWQIENIIAAATKSHGEVSPHRLEMLKRGDALPRYFVQDWLDDAGCFDVSWRSSPDQTPPPLADFHPINVGARPASRSSVFISAIGVSAADFVAYLIKLHRLGIDAGALAAASALRPAIARRKFLTSVEIHVLWARREIDRFRDPLVIRTAAAGANPVTIVGRSGHTLSVVHGADGNAVLIGHGPKPSRRKIEVHALSAMASRPRPSDANLITARSS